MVGKEWRPEYFDNLVAFYADPSDQRTITQFALENGVSPDTVHLFKKRHSDELWAAVDSVRARYIPKLRTEAFRAVFANIKKSHQDRALALKLTRDLIDVTETKHEFKSPEEKRARIEQLMQSLSLAMSDKADKKKTSNDSDVPLK